MEQVGVQRHFYSTNGLNRPLDLSLTTEDIDGARPRRRCFTTNRCTDPLDPEYHLPSFKAAPPHEVPVPIGTIPTNFVADIVGPRRSRLRAVSSGPLDVSDIPYAQPSHYRRFVRPLKEGPLTDTMAVQDINQGSGRILPPRGTDPLEPEYVISTKNTWKLSDETPTERLPITIGPVEASKPRKLARKAMPVQAVVEGSQPQRYIGRVPHSSIGDAYDTYRKPVPTGSGAGSLKRGIVTKRSVNPLDPNYSLLNGDYDSAYKLLIGSVVTYKQSNS